MTLPSERYRAVRYTERFLLELCNPKLTPRVPKRIREQARSLLRHYPSSYDMERAGEACLEVFEQSNPFQQYVKESMKNE